MRKRDDLKERIGKGEWIEEAQDDWKDEKETDRGHYFVAISLAICGSFDKRIQILHSIMLRPQPV